MRENFINRFIALLFTFIPFMGVSATDYMNVFLTSEGAFQSINIDDIDKIIPKLDEKDSEAIYQKLSKKKVEKKSSIINNRIIVAFATFVLLIFVVIPVGIMINNSNLGPNQPSGPSIGPEDSELQYNNN